MVGAAAHQRTRFLSPPPPATSFRGYGLPFSRFTMVLDEPCSRLNTTPSVPKKLSHMAFLQPPPRGTFPPSQIPPTRPFLLPVRSLLPNHFSSSPPSPSPPHRRPLLFLASFSHELAPLCSTSLAAAIHWLGCLALPRLDL